MTLCVRQKTHGFLSVLDGRSLAQSAYASLRSLSALSVIIGVFFEARVPEKYEKILRKNILYNAMRSTKTHL